MPKFMSILRSRENSTTTWHYTNTASTLAGLEQQYNYDSIDQLPKGNWKGVRANDDIRTVTNNISGNTVDVVSYRETPATKRTAKKRK